MIEEEAVVETEVTAPEPTENVRDYEKEAKEQWDWVPKEEFKGHPDHWKPARQFVKDGENFLPILKANERKLREKLETERADFAKRLERQEKTLTNIYQREVGRYEAQIAFLKDQQEKAVEAGDVAAFKRLDKQIDNLAAPEEPDIEVPASEDPAKAEADFAATSTWYGKDKDLTDYAIGYSRRLGSESPTLSMAANIRMTEEKVRQMFPHKFTKPAVNGHAAVDGGGAFNGAPPSKKGFDSLPAEAKATYERFDPKIKAAMTKAQYAEEYLNG